ncbi:hypothetical protein, partial [Sphingomonas koreensis]|uniref:hypothetical protein n=1 Tax=Sphingomonas koreensis TaxID=93064 RepID=UPI0011D15125
MRIRSVLLAATALAAALPAHAQHSRLDALERRLAEQQARIEQLLSLRHIGRDQRLHLGRSEERTNTKKKKTSS